MLGDIVKFQRGYDLPKIKMNGGIYPVVASNGIIGYHDKFTTNEPSITIGRSGTVGKPLLIKGKSWSHNTTLYIKEYKGVDPFFVYYFLKILDLKNYAGGSAVPTLNRNHIHCLHIKIPADISEQKQIASILTVIDDKIELNNRINKNLFEHISTLYKKLISESDISKNLYLSELCDFQEGYVNPAQTNQEYFDGKIKWLRAVDINESFIIDTSRTLTKSGFESAKKSAVIFKPNTIAISKSGTIGKLGIIADYMCGNRAVINIQPKQNQLLIFIYFFLKSKQKELENLAVGSVQKNLYISRLEKLIVPFPTEDLLVDFCKVTDSLLLKIHNNCFENKKLSVIRDTLLPKLMNGEIDVSEVRI